LKLLDVGLISPGRIPCTSEHFTALTSTRSHDGLNDVFLIFTTRYMAKPELRDITFGIIGTTASFQKLELIPSPLPKLCHGTTQGGLKE
jgi:hypothetical protein